jgi:hypothetical protein
MASKIAARLVPWLADVLVLLGLVLLVTVAFLVSLIVGVAMLGVASLILGVVLTLAYPGGTA